MKTHPRGLALLEAVIAVAIVGFVSVAILIALGQQLRAAREVQPALFAAELGRSRLLALRLTPPELLQSLPDSLVAGVEVTPAGAFYWQTKIETVSGQPALLESTVRVTGAGEFVASTFFFNAKDASLSK
jgi:type II secretory pathway pseudopilin PulG